MNVRRLALPALALAILAAAFWMLPSGIPRRPPAASAPAHDGAIETRAADAHAPERREVPHEDPGPPSRPRAFQEDSSPGETRHGSPLPSDLLARYAAEPMSGVPHRVVRAWGGEGASSTPNVVGLYVVVEPGLSVRALEDLARDIRAYHDDAAVLTARILNSEQAATYDRHSDGGVLAERHLVASVRRHHALGVDSIEVLGHTLGY